MRGRSLALVVALALPVSAVAACGGADVDVERPATTPELTLPEGDVSPDQGTDTTETGTTGTNAAPAEATPTETTEATPPAANQGAVGGSELGGFCEENPGAC